MFSQFLTKTPQVKEHPTRRSVAGAKPNVGCGSQMQSWFLRGADKTTSVARRTKIRIARIKSRELAQLQF